MNEFLVDVRHELKKLEHVVFVSLKFTRTNSIIELLKLQMISHK